MPILRRELPEVNNQIYSELTYHAAYEPQRAIRTHRHKYIRRFGDRRTPVLPNIDDGPTKDLLIEHGLAETVLPREQLHDLSSDPNEAQNLAGDPAHRDVLEDVRTRLETWMRLTGDPLLEGPVPAPDGAELNDPGGRSATEPYVPGRPTLD